MRSNYAGSGGKGEKGTQMLNTFFLKARDFCNYNKAGNICQHKFVLVWVQKHEL